MQKYFIGTLLDRDQSDEHAAITSDLEDRFGIPPSHIVPPHITLAAPFGVESIDIGNVQKSVRESIGIFPMGTLCRTGLVVYNTQIGQSLAWHYMPDTAAKHLISTIRNTVRTFGIPVAKLNGEVLRNLRSRLIHNVTDEVLFERARDYVEKAYRLPNSSFRICNAVFFLQENGQWTMPKGCKLAF